MNPAQFRLDVLPQLEDQWIQHCFCENQFFQKLISFNFEDFNSSPVALADAEILIHHFIRKKFQSIELIDNPGEIIQKWQCSQCGLVCKEFYSEYSISMNRSYAIYEQANVSKQVDYLIGFYGFDVNPATRFKGYDKTTSVKTYLSQFVSQ
jgi:hypothetical protein